VPGVGAEVGAAGFERFVEAFVVAPERVFVAVVVPDPDPAEGAGIGADPADDVVAVEVGCVVEGAGCGFASLEPEPGEWPPTAQNLPGCSSARS
jgi:hypothetical protein